MCIRLGNHLNNMAFIKKGNSRVQLELKIRHDLMRYNQKFYENIIILLIIQ